MTSSCSRAVILFTALGHALHHVVTALFMTVVLVLVPLWQRPYDELITLWTIGALLLGLGAPLAGWLADRFGARLMMLVFFFGIGLATIACGFARSPEEMRYALVALGFFGAIYHPVGTAWVVSNTVENQGRAIAFIGFAGSIGVASASLVAGGLSDIAGWRWAFIGPGLALVASGLLLAYAIARGRVPESNAAAAAPAVVNSAALRFGVVVLVIAMSLSSTGWHAFTTMLPKWFSLEIGPMVGASLTTIGAIVGAVYLVGTLAQFVGGHLADRGHAKAVYALSFALKCAVLLVASVTHGWAVLPVAVLVVFMFDLGSPVENILVARHAPKGRRGLAFGLRNALTILSAPLGVELVARLYDGQAGFRTLLLVLAAGAVATGLIALLLPGEHTSGRAVEAPAGS